MGSNPVIRIALDRTDPVVGAFLAHVKRVFPGAPVGHAVVAALEAYMGMLDASGARIRAMAWKRATAMARRHLGRALVTAERDFNEDPGTGNE